MGLERGGRDRGCAVVKIFKSPDRPTCPTITKTYIFSVCMYFLYFFAYYCCRVTVNDK